MILRICTGPSGVPDEWELVLQAIRRVARFAVCVEGGKRPLVDDDALAANRSAMIVGIGAGARRAHELAAATARAFRLIVADPADAPPMEDPLDIPVTALSSAAPHAQGMVAATAWRHATQAAFDLGWIPDGAGSEEFTRTVLRHLHVAGLVSGVEDRGHALGVRA